MYVFIGEKTWGDPNFIHSLLKSKKSPGRPGLRQGGLGGWIN